MYLFYIFSILLLLTLIFLLPFVLPLLQVFWSVTEISPATPDVTSDPEHSLHRLREDVSVVCLTRAVVDRVLRHDRPVRQRQGQARVVETGIRKAEWADAFFCIAKVENVIE